MLFAQKQQKLPRTNGKKPLWELREGEKISLRLESGINTITGTNVSVALRRREMEVMRWNFTSSGGTVNLGSYVNTWADDWVLEITSSAQAAGEVEVVPQDG